MTEELPRCPFCGNSVRVKQINEQSFTYIDDVKVFDEPEWKADCANECSRKTYTTEEDAASASQRRSFVQEGEEFITIKRDEHQKLLGELERLASENKIGLPADYIPKMVFKNLDAYQQSVAIQRRVDSMHSADFANGLVSHHDLARAMLNDAFPEVEDDGDQ